MATSRMQRKCSCVRSSLIVILLLLLQAVPGRGFDEVSVESFINALDKDGDGEIGQEEAKKLWATVMEQEAAFEGEQTVDGDEPPAEDVSMTDLVLDHNLDMPFSYGGSTISSAELSEHLSHMLTGERVVAWVIHGLRLPQYAAAFQENSIDGMDFPTLISDNGSMLKDDLGVSSALHRHKIHTAIFRQIFGLGQTPGAPTNLECQASSCGSISLQWDPPPNLGVPPLHKYLVQRRIASRFASWVDVGDAPEDALLDNSPELSPGVKYVYRVQAWGGHGSSEWVSVDGCVCGDGEDSACSADEQGRAGIAAADRELEKVRAGGNRNSGNTHDKSRDTGHDEGNSNSKPSDSNESASSSTNRTGSGGSGSSSSSTGMFTSVFFVNAALLLLGFAARHSTFFHVILAAYAIAWRALQKLLLVLAHTCLYLAGYVKEPLNLCGRLITGNNNLWDSLSHRPPSMPHSDSYGSSTSSGTASSRSLLACSFGSGQFRSDLSNGSGSQASSRLRSMRPGCVPGTVAVSGPSGVVTVASGTVRTISGRTMSLEDLLSPPLHSVDAKGAAASPLNLHSGASSSIRELDLATGVDGKRDGRTGGRLDARESVPGMPVDGLFDGVKRWSASNLMDGEAGMDGTASESSEGSSRREETAVSFPVDGEEEDDLQAVSAKHRCHAEGCRTRFDRWYTVQGLRERMRKHYCRDCQGVYCERHTRISPHSARSQCGLDSQCLCFNCFARLPAELQLRAEKVNKLRVGPRASKVGSTAGSSSNGGIGAGSSSAAGMSKASSSVSASSAKESTSSAAAGGGGRGTGLQEAGDIKGAEACTSQGLAPVNGSGAAKVTTLPALKSPKAVTMGGKAGGTAASPFPKLSGLLTRRHTGDRDAGEGAGMRRVVSDVVQLGKPAGKGKAHHEITKSKTDVTRGSQGVAPEDKNGEDVEEREGQEVVLADHEASGRAAKVGDSGCGSAAPALPSVDGSSRDSDSQPEEVPSCFGRGSSILGSLRPGRSLSPLPVRSAGVGYQESVFATATSPLHSASEGKPARMLHASLDGQDETINMLHSTHMQASGAPERSPMRRRALPAKGSALVKSWERSSQNAETATSKFSSTMI